MRTLTLAGLTMVTAFGGSAADAQRLGAPGASYPVPGAYPGPQPGMGAPARLPAPPMLQNRPGPVVGYPTRPGPVAGYPNRPYPGPGTPPRAGSRWGGTVGGRWSGGSYAPGGWNAYRRPTRGWHMPSYWISPNFTIGDYAGYGLTAPPQGYSWHRYYDDAVLVDARGRVWDSRGGIDWDGDTAHDGYAYAQDGYAYAEGGAGYGTPQPYAPLPPISRNGSVTTYQTGGYAGYGYPGATTTVVTIQPAETVTTTTTEYVEETRYAAAPRRVYHAPKRHYRVVRRACGCGCCR